MKILTILLITAISQDIFSGCACNARRKPKPGMTEDQTRERNERARRRAMQITEGQNPEETIETEEESCDSCHRSETCTAETTRRSTKQRNPNYTIQKGCPNC